MPLATNLCHLQRARQIARSSARLFFDSTRAKNLRVIGGFAQEGPATALQIKPQVSRLVITAL